MILTINDEHQLFTIDKVGGKAYFLHSMYIHKMNVPKFSVLSTDAVNLIISPIRDEIEQIIAHSNTNKLPDVALKIQTLFDSLTLQEFVKKKVLTDINKILKTNLFYAVRSSAVDEDGTNLSFAGQHSSYLFINKNDVLRHIIKCIRSAWSLNALAYRLANGVPMSNIRFAVILQEMVKATKSGVAFSMDVQGNMANMVLVAGFGIGDGIVKDLVETDTYYVERKNDTISRIIVPKLTMQEFSINSGLIISKVQQQEQKSAVLTYSLILKVASALRIAEELLKQIADIEFSFDEHGTLFILQMRPVTGIDTKSIKILDNTNIVESYPGVSLPLTYSFVKMSYDIVFSNVFNAFWVSKKVQNKLFNVSNDLLDYYYGRIYYRLDNWYQIMSYVFSSKKSIQVWEKSVGLKLNEFESHSISMVSKVKILFSMLKFLISYRFGNNKFFKEFNRDYIKIKKFDQTKISKANLLDHLEVRSKSLYKNWHITLINDLISFKSFNWFQSLITKYDIGTDGLANDLVNGLINSDSERAVVALLELKYRIVSNSKLVKLFSESNDEILRELKTNSYVNFWDSAQIYIQKYGDRTLSELKLETKSLHQSHIKFIELLKSQLSNSLDHKVYKIKKKENYKIALNEINKIIKWWNPKRYLLKVLLQISSYGLENRENMRFARTRIYGVVKDIYLSIGYKLHKEEIINAPEDIFYFTIEEVKNLSLNQKIKNQESKILKRKLTFEEYKSTDIADRIIYHGNKVPIVLSKTSSLINDELIHKGIPVSKGKVIARAKVVTEPNYSLDIKGKILVSKITDPGWVFLMIQSVGLISEKGSMLSHTAIVGREIGIPVVVGVNKACKIFNENNLLELDGDKGLIKIL